MRPIGSGSAPATTGTKPSSPDLCGNDNETLPEASTAGKHEAGRMSLFKNALAKEPAKSLTLDGLLNGIKDGEWNEEVRTVREALENGGKAACSKAKKQLPAVTTSGEIRGPRKESPSERRLSHSGLLQIDIDAQDNTGQAWKDLKRICESCPHCHAVFVSPSGTGVKAILRIEPSLEKHAASFTAAEKLFANLGVKVDPSTKDPARLMFVSYDPEIWINPKRPTALTPLPEPSLSPGRNHCPDTENQNTKVSVQMVSDVLCFIPPRPNYHDWFRIAAAVFTELGYDQGLPLLKKWSPEESEGEYANLFRKAPTGPKVGFGTLVHLATPHGYRSPSMVPDDVLPLAGGGVGWLESSTAIFKLAAPTKHLFIRGSNVCEVLVDPSGGAEIVLTSPERLAEFVETLGKRVAKREWVKSKNSNGEATPGERKAKWRTTTMTIAAAKVALQSQASRDHLPPLKQIVNSPIIAVNSDGKCEPLQKGYHRHGGGTFVTGSIQLADFPWNHVVAVKILDKLFVDFKFPTSADKSRAIASLISPALKIGGVLSCDFPLDVAEADQSQSGKTYRQKLVATLYNERPTVITSRKGGVGSVDESVAGALLAGRPFISLDNIRGGIDSPLLESALRGQGHANCRGFRASGNVDLSPFIFQLSTNGAEFTRDLANRSIITRIRKQPAGYRFTEHPQGDLLAHLADRQGLYLACVFSVVQEWVNKGKPQTDESRHDFREWTRSLDWIVQNLFHLPPLMDCHREEQLRSANPNLQWLRDIILAAAPERHFNRALTTTDLLGIADGAGIEFPGGPNREKESTRAGKLLGRLYTAEDSNVLIVDGFSVRRSKIPISTSKGQKDQSQYLIARN